MTLYKWSKTEGDNATADSTINWREGQAPSSVNDSARAMMVAVAKWRDDISNILITSGTGTAYAISSNQGIQANIDGFTIQFTPAATNTGAVTLSVDGQAAKPIRFRPGLELPAGVLISGSLYQVTFRAATQEWLLHSFDSSIYAIPIGASIDYWGATAPNGAFALMYGQALSRSVYADLFLMFGTGYGGGDGSSTFNIPDCRGRVIAGSDNMGGSAAGRLDTTSGMNGIGRGAVGGSQVITLTTGEMPAHTHANSLNESPHGHPGSKGHTQGTGTGAGSFDALIGTNNTSIQATQTLDIATSTTGITINNQSAGAGGPHINIQPTIVCNKLLRVI